MTYLSTILTDAPSNIWQLNELVGVTATDIVAANNGVVSGGVTLAQPGKVDSKTSFLFAGTNSNQVLAPTSPPMGATPGTIDCWINVDELTGATQTIWYNGANNGIGLVITAAGTLGLSSSVANFDSGVVVSLNAWHYVAVTLDGVGTARLYLDNNLIVTTGFIIITSIGNFNIGENSPIFQGFGFHTPFDGRIQFVAAYPTQLSTARLLAHYLAGFNTGDVGRFTENVITSLNNPISASRFIENVTIKQNNIIKTSRFVINVIYSQQQNKSVDIPGRHFRQFKR